MAKGQGSAQGSGKSTSGPGAPRPRAPRHQAAQVGTKAVQVLGIFFPHKTDGTPTPVCIVKVLPSARTSFPQWEICDKPEEKDSAAKKSPKAPATRKAPAAPAEQVIKVSGVGDGEQYHPLSAAALKEIGELQHALDAARGIHLTQLVPARTVFSLAIEKVYFLAPEDVGDSYAAYRILFEQLSASHDAVVGRMQRKGDSVPIAIFASDKGLVMYQLAPIGGTHDIAKVLNPDAWKGRNVLGTERELMAQLLRGIAGNAINEEDLEDPLTIELRSRVEAGRRRGTRPLPCSDKTVPSIRGAHTGGVTA